jgi:hypothetical protein
LSRLRAPVVLVATAVAVAVMVVLERSSRAEPAEALYVSLAYEVEGSAERCWDEPVFRRAVAQSVGYDPFHSDAALSVNVRVGASGALVHGRVEWLNAEGASMGERRFRAKDGDCSALLTEMSFAVGLQIDLLRPRQKSSTATSAAPAPATTTTPTSAVPPPTPSLPGTDPSRTAPSEQPPASRAPGGATTERDRPASAGTASAEDWRIWVGIGPSLAFGAALGAFARARR